MNARRLLRWQEQELLVRACRLERLLLLGAAGVTAIGFLTVCAARGDAVARVTRVSAIFGGLLVAAFALDARSRRRDHLILPLVAMLCGLGIVMLWRLNPFNATKQVIWVLIGACLMVAVYLIVEDMERLGRYKYLCAAVGAGLIGVTMLWGVKSGGARLWVRLVPGIYFQASEVAKILFCIFLAGYIADRGALLTTPWKRLGRWSVPPLRHVGPLAVVVVGTLAVFVLQRDLGAAVLLLGLFLSVLYVATGRLDYPLGVLLLFVIGGVLATQTFPHVHTRVSSWINPWAAPARGGYQAIQALLCLGEGGVTGTGLGRGLPNPADLPAHDTDTIFAVFGEELGLAGCIALLTLYALLAYRCYQIAWTAGTPFKQLLGTGLATVLALQTVVIVGGVIKLIPLTGVTLPFVSYGGSSMAANFVLVGLLLAISRGQSGAGAEAS